VEIRDEGSHGRQQARAGAQPRDGAGERGGHHQVDGLLHGEESELYGDQAYWSEDHRQHCKHAGIRYRVNRRPPSQQRPLSEYQRTINRARSRCRARGEHVFHVVKRLWGFAMVRYRGLAKNTARAFALFALANLYLVRRRLLPTWGAICPVNGERHEEDFQPTRSGHLGTEIRSHFNHDRYPSSELVPIRP
jgi:IS5 family transposase